MFNSYILQKNKKIYLRFYPACIRQKIYHTFILSEKSNLTTRAKYVSISLLYLVCKGFLMDIQLSEFGVSGLYVKAKGRLDLDNAVEWGTTIKDAIDDITELVLDFSEITFISSFGLKVVLELYKQMEEQKGSLKIKNASEIIMQSFKMVGFNKFLVFE